VHTGLRRILVYVVLDVACFENVGYFVKLILVVLLHSIPYCKFRDDHIVHYYPVNRHKCIVL
jgi:hypothetical protein